jgi:hypothetical protein
MSKAAAPKKSPKNTAKAPVARAKSAPKSVAKTKSAPARSAKKGDAEVTLDRRRAGRRDEEAEVAVAPAAPAPKLERREKVNRRRQIDPTTCERDYSLDEVEFMNALDDYKRNNGRMFPTCSEVLEVIRSLGYVKGSPMQAVLACDLEAAAEAEAFAACSMSEEVRVD